MNEEFDNLLDAVISAAKDETSAIEWGSPVPSFEVKKTRREIIQFVETLHEELEKSRAEVERLANLAETQSDNLKLRWETIQKLNDDIAKFRAEVERLRAALAEIVSLDNWTCDRWNIMYYTGTTEAYEKARRALEAKP